MFVEGSGPAARSAPVHNVPAVASDSSMSLTHHRCRSGRRIAGAVVWPIAFHSLHSAVAEALWRSLCAEPTSTT